MKKYFITILLVTIIVSCNQGSKKTNTNPNEGINKMALSQEMPTSHINAWRDGCGFSFELGNDTIWALGAHIIKYNRLNDSLFEIIYPKYPTVIKDVRIENYENSRKISFSNSGLACCLDKTKNEIYIGADRLKFERLSNNSIKIFYPQQSRWKISRVSDREIYIYNEKNKTKYNRFQD